MAQPVSKSGPIIDGARRSKRPAKAQKSAGNRQSKAEAPDEIILPSVRHFSTPTKLAVGAGVGVAVLLIATVSLRLSYQGRIYPGVHGDGLYLGGLTRQQAVDYVNQQVHSYQNQPVIINAGGKTIQTTTAELGTTFDTSALVDQRLQIGRTGNLFHQLGQQLSAMVGRGNQLASVVQFNSDKVAALYVKLNGQLATPVSNAQLHYDLPNVTIETAQSGSRVDIASFMQSLTTHVGTLDQTAMTVPTTTVAPSLTAHELTPLISQVKNYVSSPLTLTAQDKNWTVNQNQIIGWLAVRNHDHSMAAPDLLNRYYPIAASAQLTPDQTAIRAYLDSLAGQINSDPVDAELTVVNNQASVLTPSRNGAKLDVDKSLTTLLNTLNQSAISGSRSVALAVSVQKPAIDSANLGDLGINDLLAEGVTYFPGSSSVRLNNIRVGQSKFNNVLIKPDQVFSFGAQMGPVTAAQGYLPGLVILNGHEENQYGGGMCQVSSTLFRAALQAGLPIVERHNHSFAVSFYTAPYGVPGVDATIYYPGVDLKIKNDTGHWILIQTHMEGTTLKFDLYGTKTKSGVIRGPQFIDGTNDATKPSTTVFWRDVVVNGQVVKTDTFTTHYQSSLDFPISTD